MTKIYQQKLSVTSPTSGKGCPDRSLVGIRTERVSEWMTEAISNYLRSKSFSHSPRTLHYAWAHLQIIFTHLVLRLINGRSRRCKAPSVLLPPTDRTRESTALFTARNHDDPHPPLLWLCRPYGWDPGGHYSAQGVIQRCCRAGLLPDA
jgi:hypothetical protein